MLLSRRGDPSCGRCASGASPRETILDSAWKEAGRIFQADASASRCGLFSAFRADAHPAKSVACLD